MTLHQLNSKNNGLQSPSKVLGALRQTAFSLSLDTYTRVLPSHNVEHPPFPTKQRCLMAKYLYGLKTTLIRGGEEGEKDDFQKNQSIKPYKGERVPTLLTVIVVLLLKTILQH